MEHHHVGFEDAAIEQRLDVGKLAGDEAQHARVDQATPRPYSAHPEKPQAISMLRLQRLRVSRTEKKRDRTDRVALRDQRLRQRQRLGRPLRPDHGVARRI